MIRQIVVEQDEGRPDLVGVLLMSGDLPEVETAELGLRIAKFKGGQAAGKVHGVRWQWVPLDWETPGLEYQTIRIPRMGCLDCTTGSVTYQDIVELERQINAAGALDNLDRESLQQALELSPEEFAASRERARENLAQRFSCDRCPRWLWPAVAAALTTLIVLGVR